MQHVRLKQRFHAYPEGTVFAVVEHRGYMAAGVNQSLPMWVTDGCWIGSFEVGMVRSKHTNYCVERVEYLKRSHLFETVDIRTTVV